MESETITSIEQLRKHYNMPRELVVKKRLTQLDAFSKEYLSRAPFAVLVTTDENGQLDASPRGGAPGFIHVINDHEVAIADLPGNNLIDSLSNIVRRGEAGLLIMIPGFDDCLRINGPARLVTNEALRSELVVDGKMPKSVILISVRETFFHCTKAIARAGLWDAEAMVDRSVMPGLMEIVRAQVAAVGEQ